MNVAISLCLCVARLFDNAFPTEGKCVMGLFHSKIAKLNIAKFGVGCLGHTGGHQMIIGLCHTVPEKITFRIANVTFSRA